MSHSHCERTGKIRHESKDEAFDHLHSAQKRYGSRQGELSVYRCETCGGWHVGRRARDYGGGLRSTVKRARQPRRRAAKR